MTKLANLFPVGAKSEKTDAMKDVLERWRKKPIDVADAVEHLIETREAATFPTVAIVLNAIISARTRRLERQREAKKKSIQNDAERRPRKLTSDERDQVRKVRQLAGKGLYWCGSRGRFVPEPRNPGNCPRDAFGEMVGYKHVSRAAILERWEAEFGEGPAPPEPRGSTEDGALADLF